MHTTDPGPPTAPSAAPLVTDDSAAGAGDQRSALAESLASELRVERDRWQHLRDAGLVGVVEWRMDGHITAANDAFLRIVGYTRRDLEDGTLNWRAITPTEHSAADERAVEQLRIHGRMEPFEKEYVHRDGHRVPVLLAAATLDEAHTHGMTLVTDLSTTRRAERRAEALRTITARLGGAYTSDDVARVILTSVAADGGALQGLVAMLEPDGVTLRLLGDQWVPDRIGATWRRFRIDAPVPLARAVADVREIFVESREVLERDWPRLHAELATMRVEATAVFPLVIEGRVLGALTFVWPKAREWDADERTFFRSLASICAQALERTQLMAAERTARARTERLQAVTAALSSALTPADVGHVIATEGAVALGATAAAVAVLTEQGDALRYIAWVGYPLKALEEWYDTPLDFPSPVTDAVRSRGSLWFGDHAGWRAAYPHLADVAQVVPSGAWAAIPLVVHDRTVGAIALSFPEARDFSRDDRALGDAMGRLGGQALERARLYNMESAARAAAEEANRAKSDFLATMSHELRTPLNAIAGYAQLLELGVHGPLEPAQREALGRIARSQRHLLELIDGILEFARVDAGRVRYRRDVVTVAHVAADAEALIAPAAHARGITLAVEGGDDAAVLADGDRLRQVFVNLLTNAVKYTPQEGRVELAWRVDDDRVVVTCRDDGIGIAPDRLEVIFEPFVQLERRLDRPADGVGLGLAIVRELVRGMDGEIAVESTVGVGTTFTVRLPLATAVEGRG